MATQLIYLHGDYHRLSVFLNSLPAGSCRTGGQREAAVFAKAKRAETEQVAMLAMVDLHASGTEPGDAANDCWSFLEQGPTVHWVVDGLRTWKEGDMSI